MSCNAMNMGIFQSRMENGKRNSSMLSSANNMPIQGQGVYSMGYMHLVVVQGRVSSPRSKVGSPRSKVLSGKGK